MKTSEKKDNIAFIDGQNLYMSTTTANPTWEIDLSRFRLYLEEKYNVGKAYYFLGYTKDKHQNLYDEIQEAGFILKFREHSPVMLGKKKGNVDTDIVFSIMKRVYESDSFNKIVLVSGDGDYKMMVDFLIEEEKFEKILFPDQSRSSSLYKDIDLKYRADLNPSPMRRKIEKQK
ncbi:MAG: NYN domain-containing protein [Candidatus Paceibacterota bacterium]